MHAHNMIEDCANRIGCSQYDVFELAFQYNNISNTRDEVRAMARHAYDVWCHSEVKAVGDIGEKFCLKVLSGQLPLLTSKGGIPDGRKTA